MFGRTKNQLNARAVLVLAVAAFAGAAPVCVQAGTADAPASVHVKYSDLNLNTPKGARRLLPALLRRQLAGEVGQHAGLQGAVRLRHA
jgi:hypothetical protein